MTGAWRAALALVPVFALLACARETDRAPGIEGIAARVVLDRSEVYAGDPLGVTIEVDVPAGHVLQSPQPVASDAFASEGIEAESPQTTARGTRYAWRWTLRPRLTGALGLPELRVPMTSPAGDEAPVRIASLPLRVRSVRVELSSRSVLFDIRDAEAPPSMLLLFGGLGLAASLVVAAIFMARSRRRYARQADARALARRTFDELAQLPKDAPRDAAEASLRALWAYLRRRWSLERSGLTSVELPERVDPDLRNIVSELERARFGRAPSPDGVDATLARLREYLSHAASA